MVKIEVRIAVIDKKKSDHQSINILFQSTKYGKQGHNHHEIHILLVFFLNSTSMKVLSH